MPRDPKDVSIIGRERQQRVIGELEDQKDPIRLRVGTGPAGSEGPAGKDGATWYTGAGAPSSELGVNNDLYLRTSNDEVYKKVAGAWTELTNIKGEKGEKGETGNTGATGPSGTGAPLPARLATAAALPAYTRTTNKLEANANGALGKIDEVTAAVNDLILLKDGAAGADNGVYKITSVGGTLSKWTMERYESMDTSPEAVSGMLITVSEGARNKDEVYQLTTDAPITLNTTALTFKRTAPRDFGLVEALPTSEAIKGDRCTYIGIKGEILWNFIYDGEGELPWKFVGGPALFAEVAAAETTASATYANLATVGPSVTVPLKGDYDVELGVYIENATESQVSASYAIGAAAASDEDRVFAIAKGQGFEGVRARRKLNMAASAALVAKYKTSAGTAGFRHRYMRVQPVRVG